MRPEVEFFKIAESQFAKEEQSFLKSLNATDVKDGFYKIWTKKEAFIKAHGMGLQIPLGCFDVNVASKYSMLNRLDFQEEDYRSWWIKELDAGKGYQAAVCTNFQVHY